MLTDGETESLRVVVELESENSSVPRNSFFGGQNSFFPGSGVEECWCGGFGAFFSLDGFAGESGAAGGVEGADVVGGHHGFGCFAVCCWEMLVLMVLETKRRSRNNLRIAMNSSVLSNPAAEMILDAPPG